MPFLRVDARTVNSGSPSQEGRLEDNRKGGAERMLFLRVDAWTVNFDSPS